jgi:hypothetical protein
MGESHTVPWENRDLIAATSGWSVMNQEAISPASVLMPNLEKGIWELTNCPDCYVEFEVKHGLGTIKEVLLFYRGLLQDCLEHPFTELYGAIVT